MNDAEEMRNDRTDRETADSGRTSDLEQARMRRDAAAQRDPTTRREDTMTGGDARRREDGMAREGTSVRTQKGVDKGRVATADTEAGLWPDMADLRQRFDTIQSEFIEDPKAAVDKAEGLIKELVERLTRSMHERVDTMHRGVEGTQDTEQLRQAMRGYRELVLWMEGRRAA
jgi:hypothetical protein